MKKKIFLIYIVKKIIDASKIDIIIKNLYKYNLLILY